MSIESVVDETAGSSSLADLPTTTEVRALNLEQSPSILIIIINKVKVFLTRNYLEGSIDE